MNPIKALKRLVEPSQDDPATENARRLLDTYLVEVSALLNTWDTKPKDVNAGRNILDEDAETQLTVIRLSLTKAYKQDRVSWNRAHMLQKLVGHLVRRKLPYTLEDIQAILTALADEDRFYKLPSQGLLRAVSAPLQATEVLEACRPQLLELKKKTQSWYQGAEQRKFLRLLQDILADDDSSDVTLYEDEWSAQAKPALEVLEPELKKKWLELLTVVSSAGGSKPSKKWLKKAKTPLENLGEPQFVQLAGEWFGFLAKTSGKAPEWGMIGERDYGFVNRGSLLDDRNTDLLKGLAWTASLTQDAGLAAALADGAIQSYRKLPGHGPRASKVGNACVYALAKMGSMDAIAQLERVRLSVKQASFQKSINKALNGAAERLGMSRADLEEMTVPHFGLGEGKKTFSFGDIKADLVLQGLDVSIAWFGADGKPRKTVPTAVKRDFKAELKELKKEQKDIAKMLSAQKDRLERLPLAQRAWDLKTWRERYLDHPLIAGIARKLIWQFEQDSTISDGFYFEGDLVNADGQALDWLTDETTVRPWHPVFYDASEVLAWRDFLERREITQPFKQAHREVYLLTDAERTTRIYSNRFAAHILKQHQFNSLCAARGWKNQLRLMVDDDYTPAMLELPQWNLRAEFWIEGIGGEFGVDTNDTGTYLYLTTDQVRFYPLDATKNYAHAGGGGYSAGYDWQTRQHKHAEPLALETIPPLAFSEVMRDVDLFVGVASVANDPTWHDGGPQGRHVEYWQSYSFGELSASAKTRKEQLEKLIPRLKIADRCEVMRRFLKVKGDVRSYKIHLGSGNILMEPNDEYLCIVPSRGMANRGRDKVFLPFEGDKVLSIILSKAFMLAEDTKITDPTILTQIRL